MKIVHCVNFTENKREYREIFGEIQPQLLRAITTNNCCVKANQTDISYKSNLTMTPLIASSNNVL